MLKEKHQSEKEILWANEKQKEPIPKEGKDLDTEVRCWTVDNISYVGMPHRDENWPRMIRNDVG